MAMLFLQDSSILLVCLLSALILSACAFSVKILRSRASSQRVLCVALSESHEFSKKPVASIRLIPGLGVEGDCHLGTTVQHRSRLHIRPPPANLRQVHLIQNEILQEYNVKPADIGENITTVGLDLLSMGKDTKLHFLPDDDVSPTTDHPVIKITGLRNPCPQIEKFRKGLQEQFIGRNAGREIVERKAGVMSTVEVGGIIHPGMKIIVEPPAEYKTLECV